MKFEALFFISPLFHLNKTYIFPPMYLLLIYIHLEIAIEFIVSNIRFCCIINNPHLCKILILLCIFIKLFLLKNWLLVNILRIIRIGLPCNLYIAFLGFKLN
jgi:hypothetical protein